MSGVVHWFVGSWSGFLPILTGALGASALTAWFTSRRDARSSSVTRYSWLLEQRAQVYREFLAVAQSLVRTCLMSTRKVEPLDKNALRAAIGRLHAVVSDIGLFADFYGVTEMCYEVIVHIDKLVDMILVDDPDLTEVERTVARFNNAQYSLIGVIRVDLETDYRADKRLSRRKKELIEQAVRNLRTNERKDSV